MDRQGTLTSSPSPTPEADPGKRLGQREYADAPSETSECVLYKTFDGSDAGPMDTDADARDVVACLRGDGEAFRRLVERHQNGIASLMWRFTHDPAQQEELVHDAFVEAWRSLRSFKTDRPFGPWLRTVAVHVGYRYWKRLGRARQELSLEDMDDIAEARDPDPERADELVHGLLGRLSPRDRLVLTLIYLEGHTVAETAQLTGWSKTMVKVQAYRARAKLARLLQGAAPERTQVS
jgi:RNA polymerase sigma-70 factor (ECF subfamily)